MLSRNSRRSAPVRAANAATLGRQGHCQFARCGLTRRSSRPPPAGQPGRDAASTIILIAPRLPCRRERLSSNVRLQGEPMPQIEATKRKLAEAQFFLFKLNALQSHVFPNEPEAYEFYLSAFLSAARSVTFALQAEQKVRYDTWFPAWQNELPPHELALLVFFNEQRVQTVHRKGAEVVLGTESLSLHEYLAKASREGARIDIWNGPPGNPPLTFPQTVRSFLIESSEVEATQACRDYFAVVTTLVDTFVQAHADDTAT